MTSVFQVKTKHTKEVLKDFIRFSYKVNYPKSTFRLCVIGIGFLVLAMFLQHQRAGMYGCAVAGILIILFAFTRHNIAFYKLSRKDENYLKEKEIVFEFGHSEFQILKSAELKAEHVRYGEISYVYKDRRNYYLLLNEEEVQVLPWTDFPAGTVQDFEKFIAQKTARSVVNLYLTPKEKLKQINESRKYAEAVHDKKIEEKNRKKKESASER